MQLIAQAPKGSVRYALEPIGDFRAGFWREDARRYPPKAPAVGGAGVGRTGTSELAVWSGLELVGEVTD